MLWSVLVLSWGTTIGEKTWCLKSRASLFIGLLIGMNTTANNFYYLTSKINLESPNFSFVHFKKIMKVLFLKYGKT